MAEYVEVMKQKRRMCNSYALCTMGCPLNDIAFCDKNSGEKIVADFSEVERIVMSWVAENPEPIYPTWYDYLHSIGVLYKKHTAGGDVPEINWGYMMAPIPADIAEKLGSQPKEG